MVSVLVRALLGLAMALPLVSCETVGEPEAEGGTPPPAVATEAAVSLTVYLRTGSSEEARLQPVEREVPTEGNLPLRAVTLLLEGPTADEQLQGPWPEGTEVRDVRVDGGVATVDLSEDALDGVGADPASVSHLEALALGALANTLTEFPTIERVRVTVDGESPETNEAVTALWGGWGLPALLSRDETLIGEEGAGSVPGLEQFSTAPQTVGSRDAEVAHVRSIRLRDRITYVRVVVEIADATDHDASAQSFPRAYARSRPNELVLEVTGIDSVDPDVGPPDIDERLQTIVRAFEVSEGQRANSLRLTLTPGEAGARDISLHTRDSPSRIVLDIRK